MNRSSLNWELMDRSPISSRNSAPSRASSTSPFLGASASVNAPPGVPEQGVRDHGVVEPGYVLRDETASPVAQPVNRPGRELLAHTAFSGDENRIAVRSDRFDELEL